jgi:hypothetical protein
VKCARGLAYWRGPTRDEDVLSTVTGTHRIFNQRVRSLLFVAGSQHLSLTVEALHKLRRARQSSGDHLQCHGAT